MTNLNSSAQSFGSFEREPARVQVLFHGHMLASSTDVVVMKTPGAAPVRFFPHADVVDSFLRRTDTGRDARGEATRYTLVRDGEVVENAAWSYDAPDPGFAPLAHRIAFRDDVVTFEVTSLGREEIDEIVRHTDSGAGSSQAEHWDANVRPDSEVLPGAPQRPYQGTGSI